MLTFLCAHDCIMKIDQLMRYLQKSRNRFDIDLEVGCAFCELPLLSLLTLTLRTFEFIQGVYSGTRCSALNESKLIFPFCW